jgi:hypothetical protein
LHSEWTQADQWEAGNQVTIPDFRDPYQSKHQKTRKLIPTSGPKQAPDTIREVSWRICAMRKLFLGLAFGMLVATTSGCILPAYSGDPALRTQQLIFTSENLREINEEWERFWFLDQPTHCSPYRTHGGII